MKVLVAFVLLAVACVYAEVCQHSDDCRRSGVTMCADPQRVHCADDDQCVCVGAPTRQACTARSDCTEHRGGHCVDGFCAYLH